jgi:hypothetical protein
MVGEGRYESLGGNDESGVDLHGCPLPQGLCADGIEEVDHQAFRGMFSSLFSKCLPATLE